MSAGYECISLLTLYHHLRSMSRYVHPFWEQTSVKLSASEKILHEQAGKIT